MIGGVGQAGGEMMRRDMTTEGATGPGKKMMSIGHLAKAAVTAARDAGAELPKNAQGVAASGLARSADPETLFASLIAPEDPVDPAPEVPVVPDDPVVEDAAPDGEAATTLAKDMAVPVQDAPPELDDAGTFLGTAQPQDSGLTVSAEDIALQLLAEAGEAS